MERLFSWLQYNHLALEVRIHCAGIVQDLCMGRKKSKSTIEVADGVYLKKNGSSDKWHYYFVINGKQFRATTKTKDTNAAKHIALNAWQDALDRKRAGKLVEKVSFKKLSQKYIESLKGQKKLKFHSETIKRHFVDFFGKVDDISKITAGMLNDYLNHRKDKSEHKVLNQSLNKENVVFNQMMRLAVEYGWLQKELKIKRQSESQSYNRRAHFTFDEYKKLQEVSRKRVREFSSSALSAKERGRLTTRHWNRSLLHDVIILLANTGMRVDELKTITWRDVDWKNQTITLHNAGKTKSSRVVIVRGYGLRAAERIRDKRL